MGEDRLRNFLKKELPWVLFLLSVKTSKGVISMPKVVWLKNTLEMNPINGFW